MLIFNACQNQENFPKEEFSRIHKEFFGLGMFAMGIIYFYFEVFRSIFKKTNHKSN